MHWDHVLMTPLSLLVSSLQLKENFDHLILMFHHWTGSCHDSSVSWCGRSCLTVPPSGTIPAVRRTSGRALRAGLSVSSDGRRINIVFTESMTTVTSSWEKLLKILISTLRELKHLSEVQPTGSVRKPLPAFSDNFFLWATFRPDATMTTDIDSAVTERCVRVCRVRFECVDEGELITGADQPLFLAHYCWPGC